MNNLPAYLLPASMNQRATHGLADATCYQPLLATWLIVLSLSLKWFKISCKHKHLFLLEDDDFLMATGIEVETDKNTEGKDVFVVGGKQIKQTDAASARILKKRLAEVSKQPLRDEMSLFANIDLVGRLLGLSEAEKAILCFTAVLEIFPVFKGAIASQNHKVSTQLIAKTISHLTGQPESMIGAGLKEDATLVAGGLVVVEKKACDMDNKLSLLNGFGGLLLQTHENEESLISLFLKKAGEPSLVLKDFPHLIQDAKTLKAYLANALRAGERGANILFYGVPGTGKTEFVKALAVELNVELYEISFSDEDGDPVKGEARLRAYNLCQRVLAHKDNALLMFDEIEDVFPSYDSFFARLFGLAEKGEGSKSGKAWINRTLERNATPAIWVTNNASIDPAYLRRFDYSIRFPIPPQRVRMSIARHHLGQFEPSEDWLNRIASNEQMTPAQYERAAKVARVSSGTDMEQARLMVEQTLDRSATLLGQKRTPRATRYIPAMTGGSSMPAWMRRKSLPG